MSTTGNEFERPGVNYPDRADADGAENTPKTGEPTRDGQPGTEGAARPTAAEAQSGAAEDGEGGAMPPAPDTASHHAVGIGVIDDDPAPAQAQPGSHYGQDGGRETLSASDAQKEGALGTEQEQRLPAMAQNNASQVDKVAGILAQTRQDIGAGEPDEVIHILRQRLEQSGIDLPDSEIEELARQITTGDE
ncbi:hypothetical protein [Microbacterium sp. SS28]|uniref:hypothetical protein n=1 Tax=Microbacterium sp. SS28 TaxID=2919948 RepID=UPI001FAAE692|nr:hypothetical protein [Microbacterium sp. SS28]